MNESKWLNNFAAQSHDERMMTLVEDGSCLDLLVEMARRTAEANATIDRANADCLDRMRERDDTTEIRGRK